MKIVEHNEMIDWMFHSVALMQFNIIMNKLITVESEYKGTQQRKLRENHLYYGFAIENPNSKCLRKLQFYIIISITYVCM